MHNLIKDAFEIILTSSKRKPKLFETDDGKELVSKMYRFEIFFNLELNEVSGFIKKKCPAGTHLCENPTNISDIDTVNIKCKGVD